MNRLKIKEAIIVEGRYDKSTVSNYVDTVITETKGFGIFKNKQGREYIKKLALEQGIIILTDSDSAGFIIRNSIKAFVSEEYIKNAYIPPVRGKEKRKSEASREGLLGVEGMTGEVIIKALRDAGATFYGNNTQSDLPEDKITTADLYARGILGREGSREKRLELLKSLSLPEYLNTKELLRALNNRTDGRELIEKYNTDLYKQED